MKRIAAALGCLLLCGAGPSRSVDWKYWGISGHEPTKHQNFFEKNGVKYLPNNHVQVWTKGLDAATLDKQKLTQAEVDQAADRMAHYYMPELAKTQTLTKDQMLALVGYEAVANGGEIPPKAQILWELDCDGDMSRTLTVIVANPDGTIQTSNKAGEWMHNPPESLAGNLAKMVCR
jgi:hypothetical protein